MGVWWLLIERDASAPGFDGLGQAIDAVVRWRGEVDRRVGRATSGPVGTLRALLDRLEAVGAETLAAARADVDELVARVDTLAAHLAAVASLKRRFEE